jgi:hemerythrin
LKWTIDHCVFVAEIDDQHKEIFEAIHRLQAAFGSTEIDGRIESLTSSITGHFAHEERLMHAARYSAYDWHKRQHHTALRRVRQFVRRIEIGDAAAGCELVEYLTSWLHDHTRLADRMLGSFLRNHERSMFKVTFRAGTTPIDSRAWDTSNGEKLKV